MCKVLNPNKTTVGSDNAEQKMNKNYLLGLYLMTLLLEDKLPEIGKAYSCVFIRTGESDATLIEKAKCKSDGKRNERVYDGNHITMTLRLADGHIRLNFKELNYGPDFNIDTYANEVMQEIRKALYCLVEEKPDLGE